MKIFVKAKPNSKNAAIEKIGETEFVVAVKEPPVQGRANEAIIQALAAYFSLPVFKVKLIQGYKTRNKIFEIDLW